jgi:hypothetical protein
MSRPLRYVVEFDYERDEYDRPLRVSYNTSLGNKVAKSYGYQTAGAYAGRLLLELTDGTFELIRDFTHRRSWVPGDAAPPPIVTEPAQNPV